MTTTATETTTRPRSMKTGSIVHVKAEDVRAGYVTISGVVLDVQEQKRPGRAANIFYLTTPGDTVFAQQGQGVEVLCDLGEDVAAHIKAAIELASSAEVD